MNMTTFERGSIVEFGPPSARRIGGVIDAYHDHQRGETLCVLTTPQRVASPECKAKGQAFDACPVELMNVKPSNADALLAHVEDVRRMFDQRVSSFADVLADEKAG